MTYDPRKTAPTFLVYAGGWVFLAGFAVAWGVGAASPHLLELFGRPVAAGLVAGAGALSTMGVQRLLIGSWQRWNAPMAPKDEGASLRLTPDKRERLQTGQGA